MKTIVGKHNEAKVFATTIEPSCEAQIKALCDEKWVSGSKIRIMADTHAGKGCTIGTTMTVTDKIVPNLVGVDIGCGMLTTKFRCLDFDKAKLDAFIKANIPMGMKRNNPDINKKIAEEFVSQFFEIDESMDEPNKDFVLK